MDRPHILVVGLLVVAIGFFALRFVSSEPGGPDSRGRATGHDIDPSARGDSARDRFGAATGGRSTEPDRPGTRGSRSGLPVAGDGLRGRIDGRADRRDAARLDVARSSAGDGGGRLDAGRGSRDPAAVRRGASASLAAGSHSDGARSGSAGRATREERLAAAEANVDPFYDGDGEDLDDDPTDDVLLEVENKDDVDRKAEVLEDVEASEDGEWIEVGEDAMMAFPDLGNVNPNAGTITLDLIPNWNGADATDNALLQIRQPHEWKNRLQLVKNREFLRFVITDNTGHQANISFKIDRWEPGTHHNVVATWENGVTTLYVDGERVGSNTYPGELDFRPNTPMYLGSELDGGGPYSGANARLGNFKVLDSAKTPADLF